MKKIGIILALFIGVLSVQAQAFDFDCAEGVLPTGGGITAGHILSHRDVILDTRADTFTVEGIVFERRDGEHYAPAGWARGKYTNLSFQYTATGVQLNYGSAFTSAHIDQYNNIVNTLLDLVKNNGPSIEVVPTTIGVEGSRFWYNDVDWGLVSGQQNQWQQPDDLVHEDGVSRHIVVTRISDVYWVIKYNQPTSDSGFIIKKIYPTSEFRMFGKISEILRD